MSGGDDPSGFCLFARGVEPENQFRWGFAPSAFEPRQLPVGAAAAGETCGAGGPAVSDGEAFSLSRQVKYRGYTHTKNTMSMKAESFDSDEAIAEIAEIGAENESDVRAHARRGLATALVDSSLAEGVELEDAFEAAVAHIHSEVTGSENVVAAAHKREQLVSTFGTGEDDRHGLRGDQEPSDTAKEIMSRKPSDDPDDYGPGVSN